MFGHSPVEEELQRAAEREIDNFLKTYTREKETILQQLQVYASLQANTQNNDDLKTAYASQNKQTYLQLKEKTNAMITNDRKTFYEEQQITMLHTFYLYILKTIYIILLCWFLYRCVSLPSTYTTIQKGAIFVGFVLLLWYSSHLLSIFISLWNIILSTFPKNVYR